MIPSESRVSDSVTIGAQLQVHLERLASVLGPFLDLIDRNFSLRMHKMGFSAAYIAGLLQVTSGAAARAFKAGQSGLQFFESVGAVGRSLAKLNLPPSELVRALQEYDDLIQPHLSAISETDLTNFQWIREQLQFCVILALNEAYYNVREFETQALHKIFRIELEAQNLDILYRRFLEAMTGVCKAAEGHLFLLNKLDGAWQLRASTNSGLIAAVLAAPNSGPLLKKLSHPLLIDKGRHSKALLDAGWRGKFATVWSFPLITGGVVVGVVQFGFPTHTEWFPRDRELLASAVERCLMAAQKMQLVEDLAFREQQIRNLAAHMLQVEEKERRRISRELHDEAGQSLVCIRLQIEMIEMSLPPSAEEWRLKLVEARDLTEKTIIEMRRLIADLSPVVLEQFGLESALRQLVKRFEAAFPCHVRLNVFQITELPQKLEMVVYRIIQECCHNISKHSRASNVNISVSSADEVLNLQVEDDGIGFEVEEAMAKKDSFGLSGIRERVALLGGQFHLRSRYVKGKKRSGSISRGTAVTVELPIHLESNC